MPLIRFETCFTFKRLLFAVLMVPTLAFSQDIDFFHALDDEAYYLVYKQPLRESDRQLDAYRLFPRHVTYTDPNDPKVQLSIQPFGTRLCGVKRSQLRSTSATHLRFDNPDPQRTDQYLAPDCSQLLPLAQGSGVSVDNGYLNLFFYTQIVEGASRETQGGYAYRFQHPILLRLPLRADVVKTVAHRKLMEHTRLLRNLLMTVWSTVGGFGYPEQDLQGDGDVQALSEILSGSGVQISSPSISLLRLVLKFAIGKQLAGLSYVYSLVASSLGKPESERHWRRILTDPLSGEMRGVEGQTLFHDMIQDIQKWTARHSVSRTLFSPEGWEALNLSWSDSTQCSDSKAMARLRAWLPEALKNGLYGEFMEKVGYGWWCETAGLVYAVSEAKAGQQDLLLRDLLAYLHRDLSQWLTQNRAWMDTQIDGKHLRPIMQKITGSLSHTDSLLHPYLMARSLPSELSAAVMGHRTWIHVLDRLPSSQLDEHWLAPSFFRNKTEADLHLWAGHVLETFASQQRSQLTHHLKRVVRGEELKDLIHRVQNGMNNPFNWESVRDSMIASKRTIPRILPPFGDLWVPRILSLIRSRVLQHVYQTVQVTGFETSVQQKFIQAFLQPDTILQLVFGEKVLPTEAPSMDWALVGTADDSNVPQVSLTQEAVLKLGRELIRRLESSGPSRRGLDSGNSYLPLISGCASLNEGGVLVFGSQGNRCDPFLAGLKKGLQQVDVLLFLYRRLSDPALEFGSDRPVIAGTLRFDPDLGSFHVATFEDQSVVVAQQERLIPFKNRKQPRSGRVRWGVPETGTGFTASVQAIRPDPYSLINNGEWRRLENFYQDVRRCDENPGDRGGKQAELLCAEWSPGAFMKRLDKPGEPFTDWQRSTVGFPGRVGSLRVQELDPGSQAYGTVIHEILQSPSLRETQIAEHVRSSQEQYGHHGLPLVLTVHARSLSLTGTYQGDSTQTFVIYREPRGKDKDEKKGVLKILSATHLEIHEVGRDGSILRRIYRSTSGFYPLVYPHIYGGNRDWVLNELNPLVWQMLDGFQSQSFHGFLEDGSWDVGRPYANSVHSLNVKKWNPLRHDHHWMRDEQGLLFHVAGTLVVVKMAEGAVFRSDNFDRLSSRLRIRQVAPLEPKIDGSQLRDYPFNHLPLGAGMGIVPPSDSAILDYGGRNNRGARARSATGNFQDLAQIIKTPGAFANLYPPSLVGPYVFSQAEDGFRILELSSHRHKVYVELAIMNNRYDFVVPQMKMFLSWPQAFPGVSEAEPYRDMLNTLFMKFRSPQLKATYRTYALLQDEDVTFMPSPDGAYLLIQVNARPTFVHESWNQDYLPNRGYMVAVNLGVFQSHPELLKLVNWKEGGSDPLHVHPVFEAYLDEQEKLKIPFYHYNPRFLAGAVAAESGMFAFVSYPKMHLELVERASRGESNWLAQIFTSRLAGRNWGAELEQEYRERYGVSKPTYKQLVVFMHGSPRDWDDRSRRLFEVGEGLRGQLLTGGEGYIHWIHQVDSMVSVGGRRSYFSVDRLRDQGVPNDLFEMYPTSVRQQFGEVEPCFPGTFPILGIESHVKKRGMVFIEETQGFFSFVTPKDGCPLPSGGRDKDAGCVCRVEIPKFWYLEKEVQINLTSFKYGLSHRTSSASVNIDNVPQVAHELRTLNDQVVKVLEGAQGLALLPHGGRLEGETAGARPAISLETLFFGDTPPEEALGLSEAPFYSPGE
jgi:hypothetical protein